MYSLKYPLLVFIEYRHSERISRIALAFKKQKTTLNFLKMHGIDVSIRYGLLPDIVPFQIITPIKMNTTPKQLDTC